MENIKIKASSHWQGASWGGAAWCVQESQEPGGGVVHPPALRPAFLHQWSGARTPAATQAPGPQHIRRPLLPLLALPSLPHLLPDDPGPLRRGPQRAPEVSAAAVGTGAKVHVHAGGADRGVSQRLVAAPAASDPLPLVRAALHASPVAQTGAFADTQALLRVPSLSSWTVAQQGEVTITTQTYGPGRHLESSASSGTWLPWWNEDSVSRKRWWSFH